MVTPQWRTTIRIINHLFFFLAGTGEYFMSGVGTESSAAKKPCHVLVLMPFIPLMSPVFLIRSLGSNSINNIFYKKTKKWWHAMILLFFFKYMYFYTTNKSHKFWFYFPIDNMLTKSNQNDRNGFESTLYFNVNTNTSNVIDCIFPPDDSSMAQLSL